MPQVQIGDLFRHASEVERKMYATVDYNGKKYSVTRSGQVATVMLRHKKDGNVMVIHRKVYAYGQLANKVRALVGVKLNERDMWE